MKFKRLLVLVLVLALAMSAVTGGTIAWFTDEVTSANNIIKAGNLDIELDYWNGKEWKDVKGESDILTNTLWEPGVTEVAYLRLKNVGSLALKYRLGVNVADETAGTNVAEEQFQLSDHIEFGIVEGINGETNAYSQNTEGREAAVAAVTEAKKLSAGYTKFAAMNAGDPEQYLALVVYMPTTVGNEANHKTGTPAPQINLGIKVEATQLAAEEDSFGNDYDVNAWESWGSEGAFEAPKPDENGVVTVSTAEQLAGVMKNFAGVKTINIVKDINLGGRTWVPAFVTAPDLVINGNGHVISNMTTRGDNNVGFIGAAYQNITIKDLTFKNAKVEATGSFVGGVIGNGWGGNAITLENVDLVDSEVSTSIPAKAIRLGGLIGYSPYTRGDLTLKDCDVTGSTFAGYHNVGAMVGTMMFSGPEQGKITIENCTAKNNTLKYGSAQQGAFAFGASTSGYTEYQPAGFTAENNVVSKVAYAGNTEALQTAINNGETEILLGAGEFKMPSTDSTGTVTIVGTKDTVIDNTMGSYQEKATLSFEGVTIKGSTGKANGNGSDYAALYTHNVTYTNCTFDGPFRIGRDGAKFINCTFTNLGNDYVWTYGNDATFENCTFNSDGKALLIYSDGGTEVSKVTVKNCTFNATQGAKAGAIANQNCAAIEIHNYGNGVDLTTSGNTIDSDFSGVWRIKTYESGKPKVFVNGTEYTTIALDGKTMTIDANKNVTVNQ